MGKDGLRAYGRLFPFLGSPVAEELVHAVCAFGADIGTTLAEQLIQILGNRSSSERELASASFILARTVPSSISAPLLVDLHRRASSVTRDWILATLGQMSPTAIQVYVSDSNLAAQLRPLQLTSPDTNWTRSEQITDMLTFVHKQTVES